MIVVLGVAGSGKSTQSQMLAARDGMQWLSMGELLRSVISDERKDLMLAGHVLDEQQTIEILAAELKKRGDYPEVVLDGFPRGTIQAQWLVDNHVNKSFKIRAVVHLTADRDIVRQRLLARGRQDDTEIAINERFYEYDNVIKPIIDLMKQCNIPVVDINGQDSQEVVFTHVLKALYDVGVRI